MTEPDEDYEWVLDCEYGGPEHVFPANWKFGGVDDSDPRADPRYKPTTYEYYDDKLDVIFITQTPMCDDQAIDEFTWVASLGRTFNPVHLRVIRPDRTKQMLPWTYDKATDTATLKEEP